MANMGTYKVKFENKAGSDETQAKVTIKPVSPFQIEHDQNTPKLFFACKQINYFFEINTIFINYSNFFDSQISGPQEGKKNFFYSISVIFYVCVY